MRPKRLVALHFKGTVTVEIDCDPDDAEAWTEALGVAWAAVEPVTISECAELFESEDVTP